MKQHIIDQVNAFNDPEAPKEPNGMVYQVWEDGEITLQKCGALLWQRSLHCVVQGTEEESLGATALINKTSNGLHSYIWCKNETDAYEASRLIQPTNVWIRVHFNEI